MHLPLAWKPGGGWYSREDAKTWTFKLDGYVAFSKVSVKTAKRMKVSKMLVTIIIGYGTIDGLCFLYTF